MSPSTNRTESIFAGAVALPVENRAEYLERECSHDPVLRKHVEALLQAHERSTHMLDRPVPGSPEQTAAYVNDEKPGTVVAGRYKLLERVGEGGMGTVWVAEQTEPVRRKVAVKLIKAGMDSHSVLARFEAERQALALMDHPNIAKVLDGGLTEQGRPYFVMEYVKGVPINEYCDATRLTVQERLQLFIQVCHAVQHAHQKGIIHRDLKPSNILVAPYDDKPVPKIIDFGLAKAMHQSLTDRTLHTAHESVLGTPLYMSPEQAQLNNLDVDTRSDIYSLGVLLYELLTGTTPLEKQRFKQAAWDEVRRIIREEEPPRPSTRLSSDKTLASLAAGRQTEALRLTKQVKGELDWIVMKALEKDRSRRYETANGFAADVNRYLSGETVTAVPPSAGYRLRKFVRKNKGKVIAASLVLFALLVGIISTTLAMIEARRHHQMAIVAQHEAAERADGERKAKQQAEDEAKKARQQAEMAEAVREFLEKDLIAQADPNQAGKKDVQPDVELKLKTALDRAVPQIAERFVGKPLIEASIRRAIGKAYQGRGLYSEAVTQMEKACELYRVEMAREKPDDIEALMDGPIFESTVELMGLYQSLGQKQKAVAAIIKLEDLMKSLMSNTHEHQAVLTSLVAMREIAEGKDLTKSINKIQESFRSIDKNSPKQDEELKEVEGITRATLEFVKTSTAIKKLIDDRNYVEAEKVLTRVVGIEGATVEGFEEVYNSMLVLVYQLQGKYAEAERVIKKVIESQRTKGEVHLVYMSMTSLADMYLLQGKYSEARANFAIARDGLKKALGEDHESLGSCHLGLARILLTEKKYIESEAEVRTALTIFKKPLLGFQHLYFEATSLLGSILTGQKKYEAAEPLLIKGYEGLKQQDQTAPEVSTTMLPAALDRLIQFYTETNKPDEVKKWQAEKNKLSKPIEKK